MGERNVENYPELVSPDGYRMRPLEIATDAAALAEMWNASDSQWPGTFTHGVPMTARSARQWFADLNAREIMVWDAGGTLAGYCCLVDDADEDDVAHVHLLNVAPQFQGKGLARRFLTYFVRRAAERNAKRIQLYTWSGNIKAVPLYKKCGFCWQPNTAVYMPNFVPRVLNMPALAGFFEAHDWYPALDRPLDQVPDDQQWEGMDVYTYRFAGGGREIIARADRHVMDIAAVETDTFAAAVIPNDIAPPRGRATEVRFGVENRGTEEMAVSIAAGGIGEIHFRHAQRLTLAPGQRRDLAASVDVPADPPAQPTPGRASPGVRATFVLGQELVELAAGMTPRQAVEVEPAPEPISLPADVEMPWRLNLRNRLKSPVEVTLQAIGRGGVSADLAERTVRLGPEGRAGVDMTLASDRPGVGGLSVTAEVADGRGGDLHVQGRPQPVFVRGGGELLFGPDGDDFRVETGRLRVKLTRRGGRLHVYDLPTGRQIMEIDHWPAPPQQPSEFWRLPFDLAADRDRPGVVRLTASAASAAIAGLRLIKEVLVSASGEITLTVELVNAASRPREAYMLAVPELDLTGASTVLPLQIGPTRGPAGSFPGHLDDEFASLDALAEPWLAIEGRHGTIGLALPADVRRQEWHRSSFWLFGKAVTVPPGGRHRFQPLRLRFAEGDAADVRRWWQGLAGQLPAEDDPAPFRPRPHFDAYLAAEPVASAGEDPEGELLVDSRLSRFVSGQAELTPAPGWSLAGGSPRLAFQKLNWQNPASAALTLRPPGRVSAGVGQVRADGSEGILARDVTFIQLATGGGAVEVQPAVREGQDIWRINSEAVQLEVAPAFGGCGVSLVRDGCQHLLSSFPDPGARGWISPFFGGIRPLLGNLRGGLHRETATGQPVEYTDDRGWAWKGVRVRFELAVDEDLAGLVMEYDYLALSGSPVLQLVARAVNTTSAVWRQRIGFFVFCAPGGQYDRTELIGPNRRIRPGPRAQSARAGAYAAAVNAADGSAVVLSGDRPCAEIDHWGSDGGHLEYARTVPVRPHAAREIRAFLACLNGEDQARLFGQLGRLLE